MSLQAVQDAFKINPWLIVGGVIIGVIGKYVYDHAVRYFKADDKSKVVWDMKGFALTGIVSIVIAFLIYGVVYDAVKALTENFVIFSSAVQSGFFSQSIIGELAKKYNE